MSISYDTFFGLFKVYLRKISIGDVYGKSLLSALRKLVFENITEIYVFPPPSKIKSILVFLCCYFSQ